MDVAYILTDNDEFAMITIIRLLQMNWRCLQEKFHLRGFLEDNINQISSIHLNILDSIHFVYFEII